MNSRFVPPCVIRSLHLELLLSIICALVSTSAPAHAQGIYVASTGHVGIGLSDPGSSFLYIFSGAADNNLTLESTSSNQYDQSITFKDPGGSWVVGQRWQTSANNFGIGTDGNKDKLTLDSSGNMYVAGSVTMGQIPVGSPIVDVCADSNQRLVNCSTSSLRYKENVRTLDSGLSVVRQLRPVRFAWKETHIQDVGLIAEEVAKVDESLTSRNKDGEIEGVQYRKMVSVLTRAVQEQQEQIVELKAAVEELRKQR
jgi:hypothetical protein